MKNDVKKGFVQDPGRRYPFITSAEGFQHLAHLSEKEKALGAEMMRRKVWEIPGVQQPPEHAAIQGRNPWMIFQSDPELFDWEDRQSSEQCVLVTGLDGDEVMATTGSNYTGFKDPDKQRRFQTAMVIVTKVAHLYEDEWTLRLAATGPGFAFLTREQLCLLDQPLSAVWSEEHRLALQFTESVVAHDVSDDLFARAEAMWGRKQTLRYTTWIARYVFMMLVDHVNINDAQKRGEIGR